MLREFTVPSTDTDLHAEEVSGGDPALVFVNGVTGTTRDWDLVIQHLAGNFRSILFDARGRLVSVGRYALRGVERPQELFTLEPQGTP